MVIALSGGLAFMLVIATPGNAITYSSGYFSTRDLLKAGSVANIICIAIIFLVAIILGTFLCQSINLLPIDGTKCKSPVSKSNVPAKITPITKKCQEIISKVKNLLGPMK